MKFSILTLPKRDFISPFGVILALWARIRSWVLELKILSPGRVRDSKVSLKKMLKKKKRNPLIIVILTILTMILLKNL